MLPLSDMNPTRRLPIMTYLFIAINVIVFLWEMSLNESQLTEAFLDLSVVPAKASDAPASLETFLDIVRSMFFHGGYEHIAGNMLYLWLFGDNIEDRLGKILYVIFYFIGGFMAAIAQVVIDPDSQIPLVGASGAIAAVLGGYLVLFPGVKVRGIIPIGRISQMAAWPAWAVLGMWFVVQLFSGITSLGVETAGGGVAFFAHIGGFVAGMIMVGAFAVVVPQPEPEERREKLYQRSERHLF